MPILIEQLLLALPEGAQAVAAELGLPPDRFTAGGDEGDSHTLALAGLSRPERHRLVVSVISTLAKRHTIVIAVDDVDRLDEPSCAALAELADGAARQRLLLIVTKDSTLEKTRETRSLELLTSACTRLPLAPLDRSQIDQLLLSVFGDVPNMQLLSQRVFSRARGNPGVTLELVQHVVDANRIVYHRGAWTLPPDLRESELPLGDGVLVQRLSQASDAARGLVAAHGFALHDGFTRDEYSLVLPQHAPSEVDLALDTLIRQQIVASDGRLFWLTHRAAGAWLVSRLAPEEARLCHIGLARVYEQRAVPILMARHCFSGGLLERGIEVLAPTLSQLQEVVEQASDGFRGEEICAVLDAALSAAEHLQRSLRERMELRRWLVFVSGGADAAFHGRAAPAFVAQLERDSGLCYLRDPDQPADAGERLARSLARASAVYEDTAVALRVYRPDEAIKHLVSYVATSLAVGSRTYDGPLLCSLPPLLEPYAALSPLVYAIWQNAAATLDIVQTCSVLRGRGRWLGVLERLPAQASGDLSYVVQKVRGSIAFALGLLDARVGLRSADQWLAMLDADRLQSVSGMYLRKLIRLQYGDLAGSERCRRQAELLAIQGNSTQLFANTPAAELAAHAFLRDLQGVKATRDRIQPLAARYPGWKPVEYLAEAHFHALAGDRVRALAEVERCLSLSAPDEHHPQRLASTWPAAAALYLQLLTDAGRLQEAIAYGQRALSQGQVLTQSEPPELDVSLHPIVLGLAQAEARAGDCARASARIEGIVAHLLALGARGMHLGAAYEARARVAARAGDRAAFDRYARLTHEEYTLERGSVLVARHVALLAEELIISSEPMTPPRTPQAIVEEAMAHAGDRSQRAQRALAIVCEAHRARAGQLYLCRESGIELAASSGDADAALDLAHEVGILIQRELAADAMTTRFESEDSSSGAPCLSGLHVLACRVDARELIAGAVAVIDGSEIDAAKRAQLLQALAEHLLRAGDTKGVAIA